ncbi:hypothetical protein MTR_2g099860 [Medicago truncatula]|uniref:Uncharacterized protein n=1 Tax=Medicago truncatula TaxID=3880 RepID=A0A072VN00_MEDTR|nr:hypothetical protein MTR_2g099860 [Medicago truncatula]
MFRKPSTAIYAAVVTVPVQQEDVDEGGLNLRSGDKALFGPDRFFNTDDHTVSRRQSKWVPENRFCMFQNEVYSYFYQLDVSQVDLVKGTKIADWFAHRTSGGSISLRFCYKFTIFLVPPLCFAA